MGLITLESHGDTKNFEKFLNKLSKREIYDVAKGLAQQGVRALASRTPVDSGETASSWSYTIKQTRSSLTIVWTNSVRAGGAPLAIMLQYGHGTGTGGYVQGQDYINPAIRPIFDKISDGVWKAVTSA